MLLISQDGLNTAAVTSDPGVSMASNNRGLSLDHTAHSVWVKRRLLRDISRLCRGALLITVDEGMGCLGSPLEVMETSTWNRYRSVPVSLAGASPMPKPELNRTRVHDLPNLPNSLLTGIPASQTGGNFSRVQIQPFFLHLKTFIPSPSQISPARTAYYMQSTSRTSGS